MRERIDHQRREARLDRGPFFIESRVLESGALKESVFDPQGGAVSRLVFKELDGKSLKI